MAKKAAPKKGGKAAKAKTPAKTRKPSASKAK